MDNELKPVIWVGSSLKDLRKFPEEVLSEVGFALYLAQLGSKHRDVKPLSGLGGASVLEVVENHDGDTYRAVYTVRFGEAIYVLHCFQKKSKSGVATPKVEIDLIKQRLKTAEQEHKKWQNQSKPK